MPRLDGIEAARRILDERPIPIVMVTAYGEEELVARAVEAGVFGYLVKPFRETDLLPAIETARARHDELAALREEAESLADALAARKAIERAKGLLMERRACPSRTRSRACGRRARSPAGRSRSSPRPWSRRWTPSNSCYLVARRLGSACYGRIAWSSLVTDCYEVSSRQEAGLLAAAEQPERRARRARRAG